jgi:flagellar assembly protein FliH
MSGNAPRSVRFTFDRSFDPVPEPVEPVQAEPPPEVFSREELDAAHAEGWQAGHAAGQAEAATAIEAAAAQALGQLGAALGDLMARQTEALGVLRAEAAELAAAVGQKLAQALLATDPLAEIENVLSQCLGHLGEEPRVVVRLPDSLVDALRERIADLARAAGFGGQVVLLGDPALHGSDARIEWAHGGAERNVLSLQSSIDEAVARFISSRRFD